MDLNSLRPTPGSTKNRKRKGRGPGSGIGKTSGRGQMGQNSRSGGGTRPGFEGGQTPLFKRLRKVGFNNYFRKEYAVVNVKELNNYEDGTVITSEVLKNDGLIKRNLDGLKVLGDGELTVKLDIKANKFSQSAKEKIEAVGGSVEVI
ncbi:MAG: 50S ribosomal protein L15 [Candidatus Izimaplasma sp.]|nr:50S ribosomal protein L15 [Candidatus Izimaplasma bacterium]